LAIDQAGVAPHLLGEAFEVGLAPRGAGNAAQGPEHGDPPSALFNHDMKAGARLPELADGRSRNSETAVIAGSHVEFDRAGAHVASLRSPASGMEPITGASRYWGELVTRVTWPGCPLTKA